MVDAHALGACGLGRAGSNPASPTKNGNGTAAVCRDETTTGRSQRRTYFEHEVRTR